MHFVVTAIQRMGFWQAKIKLPDGGKIHKSFSVRRFGGREVFRRAVAARAHTLTLIEERPHLYNSTAKRVAALALEEKSLRDRG